MKKKSALFLITVFCSASVFGEVQWASKVIDFSSQYESKRYSADQILGKPNAMPQGGNNCVAWRPGEKTNKEFIKVGFSKPMKIKQVIISEPYNASAIKKVTVIDGSGKEIIVYKASPKLIAANGRLLHIKLKEMTSTEIVAVRVDLVLSKLNLFSEIDAIGISDSYDEYIPKPNVATDANFVSKKENLGANINSTYDELLPVISPDGKVLYFVRGDDPNGYGEQDIWYSMLKTDGTWDKAVNIGEPLNNARPNFVSSVSPDGNTLLLGCTYNSDGSAGVSFTTKNENNIWNAPVNANIKNFYNKNTYNEYSLSNSGKVLLMTVERDDSYGDKDIYVSFLNDDGSWTEPMNIGKTVNTASGETSPYLAADEKTLYFSTDGFSTFGSYDIFFTRRLDDTWQNWSEPVNIGSQLNTPDQDWYYTISSSGEFAYFVSSYNSLGSSDIFKVALPKEVKPDPVILISGKVFNAKTKQPISADITYQLLPDGQEAGLANSNPVDGTYKIVLPSGKKYAFSAAVPGFIAVNENIDLSDLKEYKEITQDLYLVPIEVGQTVRLNNIFFETGKSDLLPASYVELDKLVKVLNENPNMEIEVEGHTDNVGSDPFNLSLSKNRAKAVYDYLIFKGISASRIKSNGYGETKPIETNDTEEGRAQNRRVQFTIMKK